MYYFFKQIVDKPMQIKQCFYKFGIPSKALASMVKCAGVAPQAYKGAP